LNHFMDGEILEDHTARWETLIIDRTRIDSKPVEENMLPDLVGSDELYEPGVERDYDSEEAARQALKSAGEASSLPGLNTSPRYAISTGDDGSSVKARGSVLRAPPQRKVTQRLKTLATPGIAEGTETSNAASPSILALRRLRIRWESVS
jgi:hypothetical protein